jgi:hypothetical protein
MGHAYKILLQVMFKGMLEHVEVLHYTNEESANEAFQMLAAAPQLPEGIEYILVKLYQPEPQPRKYSFKGRDY